VVMVVMEFSSMASSCAPFGIGGRQTPMPCHARRSLPLILVDRVERSRRRVVSCQFVNGWVDDALHVLPASGPPGRPSSVRKVQTKHGLCATDGLVPIAMSLADNVRRVHSESIEEALASARSRLVRKPPFWYRKIRHECCAYFDSKVIQSDPNDSTRSRCEQRWAEMDGGEQSTVRFRKQRAWLSFPIVIADAPRSGYTGDQACPAMFTIGC